MWFTLRFSNWLVSDPLSLWRTGDLTRSVSRCVGGSQGDDSLAGVVGALEGCSWWERLTVPTLCTDWKHQAFPVVYSEPLHCENVFKMDSSILSLVTRFPAFPSVAFLAGIMSLSVDHGVRSILLLCADCWHTVSHSVCRQRGCYPSSSLLKSFCDCWVHKGILPTLRVSCIIRPPSFSSSTAVTSWKTRELGGITFPINK
jgi:hypothetical protein